jgi:hypothetical protein
VKFSPARGRLVHTLATSVIDRQACFDSFSMPKSNRALTPHNHQSIAQGNMAMANNRTTLSKMATGVLSGAESRHVKPLTESTTGPSGALAKAPQNPSQQITGTACVRTWETVYMGGSVAIDAMQVAILPQTKMVCALLV